ncbi:MAG: hypothetical protein CME32_06030 [Gimesia sp.]|nr:hypothetical protein [Gimesia sp.]
MKVFYVREDVNIFQSIAPVDQEIWSTDRLTFDVAEKPDWSPVECYVQNPKLVRGNFFYLCPGLLGFDHSVYEQMDDLFETAGQILPIDLEGETLYGLNVLECPNALDQDRSEWKYSLHSGKRLRLRDYVFHPDRFFESSLFKIPETSRSEILSFSDLKDQDDEFKYRYEQSGFTGLAFEEIWNSVP